MALALAVTAVHVDHTTKELIIKATPSGSYANSGTTGDVVNLQTMTNPGNKSAAFVGYPGNVEDFEVLQAPAGYDGVLVQGATPATWGLRVFQSAGLLGAKAELTNGAYPAGVLAGTFMLRIRGTKLQF